MPGRKITNPFIPPNAPIAYRDLYTQLQVNLNTFNTGIRKAWDGSTYSTLYAGQLSNANSNNGAGMLSSFTSITLEIMALKALGVKALAVEVSFPMLYQPFLGSQYSNWVTFYTNVANAIRAQNLKVIVESQSMMPSGLQSSAWGAQLAAFYPTLNWTQYQAARAQAVGNICTAMAPDYYVLQDEPDTEASQSGQSNVNTVSGSVSMMNQSQAAAAAANISGMQVGAGLGPWLLQYQSFINSYVTQGLNFIDMHFFPLISSAPNLPNNPSYLLTNFAQNALNMIATVKAANIPMSMVQGWLRKVRNAEWPPTGKIGNFGSGDVQEAREVYDFWLTLDAMWLKTVVTMANYAHMMFVAPFDSEEFRGEVSYSNLTGLRNEGGNLNPNDVYSLEGAAASSGLSSGQNSTLGKLWHDMIVSPPDVTAPTQPGSFHTTSVSSSQIALAWAQSTDAIGVAGYSLTRNGTALPTTIFNSYTDTGLTSNTSYTYQVQAYDVAGNFSTAASLTTSTTS